MSVEGDDDSELRDLVAGALQSSGVLGKLKAQLRSNVYLALEGQNELKSKSRDVNPRLDDFLRTSEGRLAAYLVREFLDFFDLDYSLCVFEPEALEGRCHTTAKSREKLCDSLGLGETLRSDVPLLSEIIRLSKVTVLRSETPTLSEEVSHKSEDETSLQSSLNDESHKSTTSQPKLSMMSATTPTHSMTPESSLSAMPTPSGNKSLGFQNQDISSSFANTDLTFVVDKESKPEPPKSSSSFLTSLSDLPKLGSQASLGDLPPLTSNPRTSPVKLAALKKVPSIEKPPAQPKTKSEVNPTPPPTATTTTIFDKSTINNKSELLTTNDKKVSSGSKLTSEGSLEDDEIEEEMDDFLNSSVSASEDFTKDETASEAASLRADFVEKLP